MPSTSGGVLYQGLPRRQLYATMGGLMASLLLAGLDQTIVGTAMPRIVADLHGFEHYAWPTTAYLLASTSVVPIVGALSDIYGRKRFLVGGAIGFVLASLLCGLAQDMVQLSLFRGLQGLGGGALMASVFTLASALFPPAKRARVQGFFSGTWGLASITGPILGGYLTDTLGWRSIFYVNVPVGSLAVAVLWLALTDVPVTARHRSIDFRGAAALVGAVVPFLLAITWGGHDYAWLSPQVTGLLVLSLVMLAIFLRIEAGVEEPILPLAPFRNPVVAMAGGLAAIAIAGMFGAGLFVPLFVQAVIGTSATQSGSVMAPMMVAMVASSIGAGQLMSRTARYKWFAVGGVSISAFGMYLLSGMGPDTDYATVARNIVLIGLGMGTVMPCFNLAAQNAVGLSQIGVVTSLVQFLRSIGGTVGAALLGSTLVNSYGPALQQALPPDLVAAVPPGTMDLVGNPQALLNPQTADGIREALARGGPTAVVLFDPLIASVKVALTASLHEVFLTCAILLTASAIGTLFFPNRPLRTTFAQDPESTPHQTEGAPGHPTAAAAPAAGR